MISTRGPLSRAAPLPGAPDPPPSSCSSSLGVCALAGGDGGTLEATGTAGGNETGLLSGGCIPTDGGGVANVLVVTTTVGVLHRVHSHTTHLHREHGRPSDQQLTVTCSKGPWCVGTSVPLTMQGPLVYGCGVWAESLGNRE